MVGKSHSIGQTTRISRSAMAGPVDKPKNQRSPARPASMSRDQWVS
jgi:hypothetical protein